MSSENGAQQEDRRITRERLGNLVIYRCPDRTSYTLGGNAPAEVEETLANLTRLHFILYIDSAPQCPSSISCLLSHPVSRCPACFLPFVCTEVGPISRTSTQNAPTSLIGKKTYIFLLPQLLLFPLPQIYTYLSYLPTYYYYYYY